MFEQEETQDSGFDFRKAKAFPGSPEDRLPQSEGRKKPRKENPLDDEDSIELHGRLMSYYRQELDRQAINRAEMAQDEDFYDNIQWDAADAQVLKERGQVPLVYNVISSSVNWVIGTEKRGRSDFRILPRRKDGGKQAERKTQLMKYLSDVNRHPFHKSRAFEDCVKVGLGWMEDGVQDDDEGEPVYTRYESWRNILWDSASTEKDLSDARYVFRTKWVDLDFAEAMFPDRFGLLRMSAHEGDRMAGTEMDDGDDAMDSHEDTIDITMSARTAYDAKRRRVRLIECWFTRPVQVKRMRGGDFTGEVFDEHSPGHQQDIEAGSAVIVEKVMRRMHVAIMTTQGMLFVGESPFRHNQFPFTPIWAYRRGRDQLPYGMIRGMKDIQQDINKRASKALHILSTNKVVMDEGAVDDLEEFREEVSRPDALLVKKHGKELTLNAERELAPAHLDLMSRSIQMIQSQSGVTDENLGRQTNATSGRAITARQEQGSMATAAIFDNLRFASQVQGEKQLSLIEQYFTDEKQFRITNIRGTPQYVTINDGLPENDIARTKADFVISEADWRASVRQAQTEELLSVIAQLAPVAPQVVMVMLDLVFEGMDLPSREELVKRVRAITGMRDPDAEEPTAEELAQEQAQQKQQQMQEAMFMAELQGKQADAAKKQADADHIAAKVVQIQGALAGQNVQTQKSALEAALAALANPATVPVADGILQESGFLSRTEQEETARQEGIMQAENEALQQAQMEEQAMAAEAQQQAQQGQQLPQE